MKKVILTAFICLTGMWAQAQTTQVRQGKEATKIEVKDGIEVIITQNDTTAVKIETATAAILQKVVTKYSGNTLKISLDNPDGNMIDGAVTVYVSQKSFPLIKAQGGSAIKAAGKWAAENADIDLATGATFTGELEITGTFTVKAVSGAVFRGIINAGIFNGTLLSGASAKLQGTAKLANVYCSGGSLQAAKFICQKAKVLAQNASSVSIQAKEFIKAEADTSSSVTYYGEPGLTQLGDNTFAIKRNTNKLSLN